MKKVDKEVGAKIGVEKKNRKGGKGGKGRCGERECRWRSGRHKVISRTRNDGVVGVRVVANASKSCTGVRCLVKAAEFEVGGDDVEGRKG